MRNLSPVQVRLQQRKLFPPTELDTWSHAFIRVDSVREPLKQHYKDPFRVISRHDQTFKVDRLGCVDRVNRDLLKDSYRVA